MIIFIEYKRKSKATVAQTLQKAPFVFFIICTVSHPKKKKKIEHKILEVIPYSCEKVLILKSRFYLVASLLVGSVVAHTAEPTMSLQTAAVAA